MTGGRARTRDWSESALKAQNRRLVAADDTELDDDLVRDMTEVLTSFCMRLYGRRAPEIRRRRY